MILYKFDKFYSRLNCVPTISASFPNRYFLCNRLDTNFDLLSNKDQIALPFNNKVE